MPELVTNLVQVHPCRIRGGAVEHLLLLRASGDDLCPDIWQVITGGIEPGESSVDAARRELLEETGLEAERWSALPTVATFYFARRDQIVLSPVLFCELPGDAGVVLSAEHVEHRWLPVDAACDLLAFPSHREGARAVDALVEAKRTAHP